MPDAGPAPTRVAVADRRKLVREALLDVLTAEPRLCASGSWESFAVLQQQLLNNPPDVLVLGKLRLPAGLALTGTVVLRLDENSAAESVREQVLGRLPRQRFPVVPQLPNQALTVRQEQILRMMSAGMPVRDIALSLGVSPSTVEHHKQLLYLRTGLRGQTQAVSMWIGMGQRTSQQLAEPQLVP